jgi:HEAT repeat protein
MSGPGGVVQPAPRGSDEFSVSEPIIDRAADGARVTDLILSATSRFVVLHGKPGSGRTQLVKHWVIPALQGAREAGGYDVLYGDCAPAFPTTFQGGKGPRAFEDAVAGPAIVIADGFANVFDLPRDERRRVLDRIVASLKRGDPRAIVVLVIETRQLTSVYALSSEDPAFSNAVLEIGFPRIDEALASLAADRPDTAVHYAPDMLRALGDDAGRLEEAGGDVTFDLITLLDARFRRFGRDRPDRQVELGHYQNDLGGLLGVLQTHLDSRLAELEAGGEGNEEVARALLERIVAAPKHDGEAVFDDVPRRLGVPAEQVSAVLARVAAPGGLVRRRSGKGGYRLAPPALAAVLVQEQENRRPIDERARRTVAEGLRSFQQLGHLLPRARFEEIHRVRTHLTLDRDHTRFLLQCALRHESGESVGASAYWLGRIGQRVDGLDILLAGLFDAEPPVRVRAAGLLRDFPEPEARDRLRLIALTDSEPAVRAEALSSLEPLQDQESLRLFGQEAQAPNGLRRVEAIEALRIFPIPEVQDLLQALVNDADSAPELRQAAIRVLARHETPRAVDALVHVALRDEDQVDREAAAEALALPRSDALQVHMLATLGPVGTSALRRAVSWALSPVAVVLGAVFWFLVALFVVGGLGWVALLPILGLPLLIPLARMLRRLKDDGSWATRGRRVVAAVLFAMGASSILVVFHGLGHWMMGRRGRALVLFGLELLGLLFIVGVASIVDAMAALRWAASFYLIAGVLFFFGSYLGDVAGVLFEAVLPVGAAVIDRRREAVYRRVLGNPAVAQLVFDGLARPEPWEARRSRRLLRRLGAHVQADQLIGLLQSPDAAALPIVLRALRHSKGDETVRKLEVLWRAADRGLRRRITSVWCRNPNQRSIQALEGVQGELGPVQQLRCSLARWRFRLAVWPLPVRLLALLCAPAAFGLLYHGVMVLTNPAWSQIVALSSGANPGSPVFYDDDRTLQTVEILTRYPESGTLFRQLLQAYSFRERPIVHARIARALVTMHPGERWAGDENDRHGAERRQLVEEAHRFLDWLRLGRSPDTWFGVDSATVASALETLYAMASGGDRVLADTATALLRDFALESDSGWSPRVLDTLAALPYERALPVLDTIYAARQGVPVGDTVRRHLERITERKYAAARAGDTAVDARKLLAVLDGLRYRPAKLRAVKRLADSVAKRMEDSAAAATQLANDCDRNGDGTCDRTDELYQLVEDDPSSEGPYRELLEPYVADRRYQSAVQVFRDLKARYPGSIWPRKIVAEVYHEYLFPQDRSAFEESYQEMVALRALGAYAQMRADTTTDYLRFEADFAEITLSAGRLEETERVARRLLSLSDDPTYHFNMALFIYLGYVMRGDADVADAKLTRLGAVVDSLQEGFYNRWAYPGTKEYIQRANLPEALARALLDLCQEGGWHDRLRAAEVINANRAALRQLAPGPVRSNR